MYIHLLLPLSNQDCVPTLKRDSPKEDTLHDSQLVSSLIPDGWPANRKQSGHVGQIGQLIVELPVTRPQSPTRLVLETGQPVGDNGEFLAVLFGMRVDDESFSLP